MNNNENQRKLYEVCKILENTEASLKKFTELLYKSIQTEKNEIIDTNLDLINKNIPALKNEINNDLIPRLINKE